MSTALLLRLLFLLEDGVGEGDPAIGQLMGHGHSHAFGFHKIAVIFRDLVELEHGLSGLVEELLHLDALLGRSLNEKGAVHRLHKLKPLLSLHLPL